MTISKRILAPLLAGFFAILLSLCSATAAAQAGGATGTQINAEGFAEPSEAQLEMNEKGVEAIVEGEYDKAARLFQASTDLGKLNITYLNLGRALQKAERCREAKQAYLNVKKDSTPKVKNPPPFEISSRAEQYLAELKRTCPGEVEVRCKPAELSEDVELFINTRGPHACKTEPFEVPPGEVVVKGVLGEQAHEKVVRVDPVELASVELTFERPREPEETSPVADKDAPENDEKDDNEVDTEPKSSDQQSETASKTEASDSRDESSATRPPPTDTEVVLEQPASAEEDKSGGAWWVAAGVGIIGGGLYFDHFHSTSRNGELETLDFIPPAAYLLGGISLLYGITNL